MVVPLMNFEEIFLVNLEVARVLEDHQNLEVPYLEAPYLEVPYLVNLVVDYPYQEEHLVDQAFLVALLEDLEDQN